jgi:hypothetical protein
MEKHGLANSVISVYYAGRNSPLPVVRESKIDQCALHAEASCICISMSRQLFASGVRGTPSARCTRKFPGHDDAQNGICYAFYDAGLTASGSTYAIS